MCVGWRAPAEGTRLVSVTERRAGLRLVCLRIPMRGALGNGMRGDGSSLIIILSPVKQN